ncbi:MAG TPA: DEAD/DEAH box helicase [Stellaceae bacterium]|jgi:superfamily II DNA/RNA helicase|nr:DEAD/DEAH box helicase [Stellaceae bacterium]
MSFEDLGLSSEVLQAVGDAGYTAPTPIQEQAIPYVLMARDVLGCAQTGTGKTASFTLPMIDILAAGRARARMPRSLILEPTRELAAQVAEAFEVYGKYHKLEKALLIGGESFTDQERKLDRGVDVLIATPGRLIDLYERGKILLSDVKILVIDEADRMLDMGFIPDVERIVGLLSKIRQTLFFSATMPPEIRRLADSFLMNPKEISVAPPASPAATVTQGLAVVAPTGKRDALRRLIRSEDVKNAIIFCNRKRDVDILHRSLKKYGFDAAALHGDMPQSKRSETLERFRNGEVKLLVASDVAARGLDIQGMSHVFNFDVPIHAEDYVHRIGRTGRAGREGRAFTLATPEDGRFVDAIQHLIGKPIPPITIPGVERQEATEEEAHRPAHDSEGRGRKSRHRRPARDDAAPERAAQERPAEPRPAAKPRERQRQPREPAFAPVTMNPAAELAGNVTKLPRRDAPPRDERDDDRRVVGFGDHMPAFLGRSRARPL